MGLGKTLTVLSTIIRTGEAGRVYAERNNQARIVLAAKEGEPAPFFSRATLVVVPSARMSSTLLAAFLYSIEMPMG
jgi:SWI/SNF-related matrix-associated actin-dependent regulator of chromatin subfamily A3